jgi:hypothetical protein
VTDSPYVKRLTGRVMVGQEGERILVINREVDKAEGLRALLMAEYAETCESDHPDLLAALPKVDVGVWRSTTKAWREGEGVDEPDEAYYSPHGDGARQILAVCYRGDLGALAEKVGLEP